MENENKVNLLDMKRVEGKKLDVSAYVGKFVPISDVNIIETKFGNALKVETDVIAVIEGNEIKASRIFSISKEGEIIIGSKLDQFMQKYKVEQPAHLMGKEVQVIKNDKDFLTF